MTKYPANRVELIEKAVNAKMLELTLSGNYKSHDLVLKECVKHFNTLYHKEPEKVYRILLTDYQIARFFIKYVAGLVGFVDLLKSPDNISFIKELGVSSETNTNTNTIKEVIKKEENTMENAVKIGKEFKNDCFKALSFYINKGSDFDAAIKEAHKSLPKKNPEYKNYTEFDVVFAIAEKCFEMVDGIKKEPFKNISQMVGMLSPEEKEKLKAKL